MSRCAGSREAIWRPAPVVESCPFTVILVWDKFSESVWTVFPEYAVVCNGWTQLRRLDVLSADLREFATTDQKYTTVAKPA